MSFNLADQQRRFICIGAALGLLAVFLGAFGAHALKGSLSESALNQYRIGVAYQFYHIGAILFGALAINIAGRPGLLIKALWGFVLGIVLFSGSLVLLALSGAKYFALATPLGGIVFLVSWAGLFMAFLKNSKE
ncbi:MAG: uncharacterized membrane protein YgdD (TMEM256/DUF423 family) [Saprospiraceae bacterium]|jgi:uncharacterized membrane protein YgdD (TMEM256/DUF423 family)